MQVDRVDEVDRVDKGGIELTCWRVDKLTRNTFIKGKAVLISLPFINVFHYHPPSLKLRRAGIIELSH
ncbi:hypothetical protein A4D02_35210 [Niastella koreensis]|uniref:Uncharacterized protein n=1 Tax=Niastella koreensis TaxID=354356 RepID=A0ABX3NS26_9BACT|nr:hypothetical protein A4D02_35210 [Niastella koreensis]